MTHKLLSESPGAYRDAAAPGIRAVLGLPSGDPIPDATIAVAKMDATLATNALRERKGAPTVLLITRGFGGLSCIGNQNRPALFDLYMSGGGGGGPLTG